MEKMLRWLNLLLILTTFISYLSPYVNPSIFWLFSFMGMAYPWLLLLNMLFVLFWVSQKNWYCLFSIGCILVGWNHFQSFVGLNTALPKAKEELTIMTFNGMSFYKLKGKTKKSFKNLLKIHQPDIVCIQEAPLESQLLKQEYRYSYQPNRKKLIIYSKFPFIKKGNLNIGNVANGCTFVEVKVQGKDIRIYNLHLQSNSVTGDASKLRKEGDIQERETWLGIKQMLGKVKRAGAKRATQAEIILTHIQKSKHSVIVCGDMNDTPLSYTYQLFSQQLKDGFKERAMGLGTTYDGTIPVLRIDYIWASPSFQVNSYATIKKNYSDHFPVISSIQLGE